MNLDYAQLRSDLTHWPALRHRLLGGWSYVLTAAAFLAVVLPILSAILWGGLLGLLVNLGRLLVWTAGLLQSIGTTLQQAQPELAVELVKTSEALGQTTAPAPDLLARLADSPEQAHRLGALIDSTDELLIDAAVRASIESMQLVDDANPKIPIEGYVIAMPSSPVPDSHVTASRPRSRKRSANGSKQTTASGSAPRSGFGPA